MRGVALILAVLGLAACRDEAVQLPSGLSAERLETLAEEQPDGETWLILRVLAPGLAERPVTAAESAADTAALCRDWGLEAASESDGEPAQVVVQMMSERVERGQPAPSVTQIFAGYRIENGACIWEDF